MESVLQKDREQKRETLSKNLAELSTECMASVDAKGRIVWCNTATIETLGFSKEEIVGKHFSEIGVITAQEIPRCLMLFRSALKGKLRMPFEITLKRKDGTLLLCEVRVGLLKDGRKVTGCQVVARDITKEKQAEEELRENEEKFRDLLENANDLIQSVDANQRFVYVNKKWLDTLGYSKEEAKELRLSDIIRKDQIPHCLEVFKRVRTGESVDKVEAVFVAKDGREVYVEGSASARIKEGKFIATRGIFRDVTERRLTEKRLAESEAKYRSLVENSLEGIGVSKGNQIVFANKALLDILGYDTFDEVAKVPLLDHVAPKSKKIVQKRIKMRGKGKPPPSRYEFSIIRKNGEIRDLEVSSNEVIIGDEKYIQSTFRDITERKE